MDITFLGTGSAWGVPEHSCPCAICETMRAVGEERTRTSLLIQAETDLLIDPGPDIRRQMIDNRVGRPEAILITHEHLDHMGGLDDLLCFRRAIPRAEWVKPIPVYAHPKAWTGIEERFGYLFSFGTFERREYLPGRAAEGLKTIVTPFKTEHGPIAKGSVGLVIESRGKKIIYTSDFMSLPEEPEILKGADLLILQAHFFNQPEVNRARHMSLQYGLEYVARWQPERVVLIHLGAADLVPGDPAAGIMKIIAPENPLKQADGRPFEIPLTTADWARLAPEVFAQRGLEIPVEPAREGMKLTI